MEAGIQESENSSIENKSQSYRENDALSQQNNLNPLNTSNIKIKRNNIENEEKVILKIHYNDKCLHNNKYNNIGNNIVLFNKYVLGPKDHLCLLILTMGGISISYFLYLFFIDNFYPKVIYYILHILFFLTELFMLLSYIIEPGIIPRNSPDYIIKEDITKDNKPDNDSNNISTVMNEQKNIDTTPRIFKERECCTCKIMRPPGASHCFVCDNCVLDFDHHCVFVSNCIGKRNHKYFFLFLFIGSIFSILAIILSLVVIIHVFIIKANETTIPLCKGNFWLLILSLLLILLSLLCCTSRTPDLGCILIPGIIGFCLLLILWYKYVPKKKNTPSYYSPFIIIVFNISIVFGFFVIANCIGQIWQIGRGFTVKQTSSILQKIWDLKERGLDKAIDYNYVRKVTMKEKLRNIIKFLLTKMDKSLIVPERDLIICK
jgi:hypothetical protein